MSNLRDASTSLSLLERARRRDDAAWERLTALYQPLVALWCRRAGLHEADGADVQQEVFLAVSRSVDAFDRGGRGAFRCWLRAITRSKIEDRRRARARDRIAPGVPLELQPQRSAPEGESHEQGLGEEKKVLVHRAVQLIRTDFHDDTWLSFWKVVVDGQPPANVAKDLGISRNAVYLAKARVLHRLREEFEDLIDL